MFAFLFNRYRARKRSNNKSVSRIENNDSLYIPFFKWMNGTLVFVCLCMKFSTNNCFFLVSIVVWFGSRVKLVAATKKEGNGNTTCYYMCVVCAKDIKIVSYFIEYMRIPRLFLHCLLWFSFLFSFFDCGALCSVCVTVCKKKDSLWWLDDTQHFPIRRLSRKLYRNHFC